MSLEALKYNLDIHAEIKRICEPLVKHYSVNMIAYRRFYYNGTLLYLFNHPDWMKYCFENKYWNSANFIERIKDLAAKSTLYYLWPEKPARDDSVYNALFDHNIWNGVIIYKKFTDCLETYAFASTKDNIRVREIYIQEPEILERFILYFKDRILSLISPIEQKILIPCNLILPVAELNKERREQFFRETEIKHYYLRINGADISLTKREEECLALLANGKKIKEIGRALELSARTVEYYLNNILTKTECKNKSQLILLYQQNRESETTYVES